MPEFQTPMDSSQQKLLLFIGSKCDEQGKLSQDAGDAVLRENASNRETLTYLYNRGLIEAKTLLGGVVRPLGLTPVGQQVLAELKSSGQDQT